METLCRYHTVGADSLTHYSHYDLNTVELLQTFTENGNVLAGSKILPMVYGALYILDASAPHCTAPTQPEKYERNLICLNKNDFTAILKIADCTAIYSELFETGSMCIKLPKNKIEKADQIFKQMYAAGKNADARLISSYTVLKLTLLLKENTTVISPKDFGVVSSAVEYIENNLRGDLSTSAIAKRLNVSKYHLSHFFHLKTGMCLTSYVKETRLKKAEELLLKTGDTVSGISEKTGYMSTAYFCKLFKERYGITPTQYRSLHSSI